MSYKSTILIVDDEASARDALEAVLIGQGYELVIAHDGPDALTKADTVSPDVILLDVMMPDMDGFEVCQKLRRNPLLGDVPVLMITALDDRDSRLRGLEAGADDFLSKPIDRHELRARVRTTTTLNRYRRLLDERARFQWVVDQAEDGYLLLDADENIVYANAKAHRYLGLDNEPGTQAGIPFIDQITSHYQCEPQTAWANWPHLTEAVYLVRPESNASETMWLQVNRMGANSGQSLIQLRDVTAKMAARRLRWTFHAQISHKLRTPLNILTNFLTLLVEDDPDLDEDHKFMLTSAQDSARQLDYEITAIFRYLETFQFVKHQHKVCGLNKFPTMLTTIADKLALDNVTLNAAANAETLYIPMAEQAVELILQELLNNAKKFHPNHTPAIEASCLVLGDWVRIQVADDGLHLSPQQLADLWTPYYQAEKYFTGQTEGMGLGLSTVAMLVWETGGTCRAYNQSQGPGLVIELELPLRTIGGNG